MLKQQYVVSLFTNLFPLFSTTTLNLYCIDYYINLKEYHFFPNKVTLMIIKHLEGVWTFDVARSDFYHWVSPHEQCSDAEIICNCGIFR